MIDVADCIRSGERPLVGACLTECRRSEGRQLVVVRLTDVVHPHDGKPHVVHPCPSNGMPIPDSTVVRASVCVSGEAVHIADCMKRTRLVVTC